MPVAQIIKRKSRNIYQVKMQELPYFVSVTDADSIICCEACIVHSFCPDQTTITIRKHKLWVKVRLKFAETNQVVVTCLPLDLCMLLHSSLQSHIFFSTENQLIERTSEESYPKISSDFLPIFSYFCLLLLCFQAHILK